MATLAGGKAEGAEAVQILKNVVAWLRGGTAGLSEVEMALVSKVLDHLTPEEARLIREQLALIRLVQRPQPGRMTIIFHSRLPPLLENREYEVCLAQVTYKANTARRRKVRLMVHSGFLQSIEGSIPTDLAELEDLAISVWPDVTSKTAQAIDRLEHGSVQAGRTTDAT